LKVCLLIYRSVGNLSLLDLSGRFGYGEDERERRSSFLLSSLLAVLGERSNLNLLAGLSSETAAISGLGLESIPFISLIFIIYLLRWRDGCE